MRAIILAAGRGERMRPLTNTRPKPLLEVNGKPLIQYHVENLARAGINEIVINHGIFGDQIENYLGDGGRFQAIIQYSAEGNNPLETGGGIYQALSLLGNEPFLAINADIWTDFPFQNLPAQPTGLAHLVLAENPEHNPDGDFAICDGHLENTGSRKYTYSGIGIYRKELFDEMSGGIFPLTPLIRKAADKHQVTGEIYDGVWLDIGTPERLARLREQVSK
jgi:MurNAc alpha-1-phosphate uridylyltransferase